MTPKVFICHSHKDRTIADTICKHLEAVGLSCWIAPRNIKPGTNWTKGIMQGLEICRVFILVFSGLQTKPRQQRLRCEGT
jgi:TIR domain-containing protein